MPKMLGNGNQEKGQIFRVGSNLSILDGQIFEKKKFMAQEGVYYWLEG